MRPVGKKEEAREDKLLGDAWFAVAKLFQHLALDLGFDAEALWEFVENYDPNRPLVVPRVVEKGDKKRKRKEKKKKKGETGKTGEDDDEVGNPLEARIRLSIAGWIREGGGGLVEGEVTSRATELISALKSWYGSYREFVDFIDEVKKLDHVVKSRS